MNFLNPIFNSEAARSFVKAELLFDAATLLRSLFKLPIDLHLGEEIERVIDFRILWWWLDPHLTFLFVVASLGKD